MVQEVGVRRQQERKGLRKDGWKEEEERSFESGQETYQRILRCCLNLPSFTLSR